MQTLVEERLTKPLTDDRSESMYHQVVVVNLGRFGSALLALVGTSTMAMLPEPLTASSAQGPVTVDLKPLLGEGFDKYRQAFGPEIRRAITDTGEEETRSYRVARLGELTVTSFHVIARPGTLLLDSNGKLAPSETAYMVIISFAKECSPIKWRDALTRLSLGALDLKGDPTVPTPLPNEDATPHRWKGVPVIEALHGMKCTVVFSPPRMGAGSSMTFHLS